MWFHNNNSHLLMIHCLSLFRLYLLYFQCPQVRTPAHLGPQMSRLRPIKCKRFGTRLSRLTNFSDTNDLSSQRSGKLLKNRNTHFQGFITYTASKSTLPWKAESIFFVYYLIYILDYVIDIFFSQNLVYFSKFYANLAIV